MTRIITSGTAASRWQAIAVLVLVSVFFGLLIGLSPVMTALNYSDSVIPVHLSIDRPDTFYWGQSRFGMLVPKLAHGIQDPWTNLFFQQVVTAGFTSFGLLALGCVFGLSWEASLVSGLFVMGTLFGSQSGQTLQTLFLIAQPYGLSLGLFVLLVLVVRDGTSLLEWGPARPDAKRAAWWAVLFLAFAWLFHLVFWINLAMVPFAIVLVVLGWRGNGIGRTGVLLSLVVAGTLLTLFAYRQDRQELLPAAEWMGAIGQHLGNCVQEFVLFRPAWLAGFLALVSAAALAGFRQDRVRWLQRVLPFFVLALASLALSVLFSLNHWVAFNLFMPRYSATSLVLLLSACSLIGVSSWQGSPRVLRTLLVVFSVAVPLIGLRTLGFPNPREGERLLVEKVEAAWGVRLKDLDARHPDFITGDYWFAWTAGFLVNAERARLGKPGRVLVLSGRSHAIHELVGQAVAKNPGRPLVSGLAAEPDFTRFLDQVFLRSVGTITCEGGIRTDALVSNR